MKKTIVLLLTAALAVSAFTGCGTESNENTEAAVSSDSTGVSVDMSQIDVSEYVTLSEYKGIEAHYSPATVSESDINERIEDAIEYLATEEEVTGRTVSEGDIVNIDYMGKKDGVAFEGGTAKDYDLTIGSGQFIPGFESGLIGAETGEVRDLNLTFPEEYGSEELAGADVVFTVSVNAIKEKITPELTDEVVPTLNPSCNSIAEYRTEIERQIKEDNEAVAKDSAMTELIQSVKDSSEFKDIPQEFIDQRLSYMKKSAESYAQQYGMTYEDFIEQMMGQSVTEFEDECIGYAEDDVKTTLVVYAIAQAEDILLTEDEIREKVNPYLSMYQDVDYDEFISGAEGRTFVEFMQMEKVCQFLFDNANVVNS